MELPPHLKTKHFLVCDDYESIRIMIVESLKSLGVTSISTAVSGNQGHQLIMDQLKTPNPIDFVITDLMMEDGSGADLARKVRAQLATRHLPMLMVTSKSEVQFVLESIKAGINSYIVKPWELQDLHDKIVELFKKAD
jgi:two-component system, chemotaxis family, chemotaxis protein CheY